MIEVHGQHRQRSKRLERRSIQVRLSPQDAELLNNICSESGRSYGEQVAVWLAERQLRLKLQQEARQSA